MTVHSVDQQPCSGRRPRSTLLIAALATAAIILLSDLVDGRFYYHDVDDTLRAIQIQQLLSHGRWFDTTIAGIDMPGAYVSPWSRLVDLPYVVLARVLETVTDREQAVWWAFRLFQPVLLFVFSWLWIATAMRLASRDEDIEPLHVIAAFSLMPLTLWEFTVSRIDHHNLQLVILMLSLAGLARWSARGGFVAGLGCGLSFAVGLELAPILMILMVGPALSWVFGIAGSRTVQLWLSAGVAASAILTALFLTGPMQMMATACDTFSAPYFAALLGYAAITASVLWVVRSTHRLVRLLALALPALALVLALGAAFPSCVAGPYHAIDPVVRDLWLSRVQQEKSFLDFYRVGETIKIVSLGMLVVVALGTMPIAWRRLRQRDAAFVIIACVGFALLALTLLQTRFIRFPAACVLLFLPLVWNEVRQGRRGTIVATGSAAVVTLIGGLGLTQVVPAVAFRPDALDYIAIDFCPELDLAAFSIVPPGRVLASNSLGLKMLGHLPEGFTVAAVPFHRAAPGMRRMYDAFLSTDSAVRREAVAPFDYVAVCRFPMMPEIAQNTMFAALTRGESWPGLVPLADGPVGSLRLLRIDHAAFR